MPSLTEVGHRPAIESMHKALDLIYREALQSANGDWQLLFDGVDPSDGCVNVRISPKPLPQELAGIPGADVAPVKKRKVTKRKRRR